MELASKKPEPSTKELKKLKKNDFKKQNVLLLFCYAKEVKVNNKGYKEVTEKASFNMNIYIYILYVYT